VAVPLEPQESARVAGLRYVTVTLAGIHRLRRGRGWVYINAAGEVVRDRHELRRFRFLVIPPAWKDVWICPYANGHLQAVGIDQRGRRQYRYHNEYRNIRDATKYTRMAAFGAILPRIREGIERDLQRKGLSKEKVLAAAVRLLESTSVRVGNEEYARENDSFGLTTLRDRHVKIDGEKIVFRFRGKSGQEHQIELNDRRLARIVQACRDIPGQELFQYYGGNGEICRLYSEDVNRYLKELAGDDFTAKDFRTWNGSREALAVLAEIGPCDTETGNKKKLVETVKRVAAKLGNRPATCRKYYIHPAIFDSYVDGSLFAAIGKAKPQTEAFGLDAHEVAMLQIVQSYVPKLLVLKRRKAA